MRKVRLIDRFRYGFDNAMSKGPIALIGWLALITFIVLIVFTTLAWLLQLVTGASFIEIAWMCLMRTIDAGTVADDEGTWGFLITMLLVTFGGIFIFSTLIGILTAGLESRLDEMRKGRSMVIEEGHTVILGWSPQIFTIIEQLVIANTNQKSGCIVVLGNIDKVEMEDEIRSRIGSTGRTRIVCRHGNPIEMADLDLVSLNTAKSIIILSPEGVDPDARVIKTMLAITNHPDRKDGPYHIVAEVHQPKNIDVVKMIGKDEAELILSGDLVAKVMAQTCLQSGLSVVYMESMNFEGDEIYFADAGTLVGKTYADAIMAYEDSSVIGLAHPGNEPVLNPILDTQITEGTRVIAFSEDDDTVIQSGLTRFEIDETAITGADEIVRKPERIIIIGWNWRTPIVINELHKYFPDGSTVTVAANLTEAEASEIMALEEMQRESVNLVRGDTADRSMLESLELGDYHRAIIMCYSDCLDPQESDAKTLITLLHLRDIEDQLNHNLNIVSEMLDIRNRKLAEVTRADDFVVSDSLISLMLSQLSENRELGAVYRDMFDITGSEIYLEPVVEYVKTGVEVNFYTVVEAARRRGQSAIGYRIGMYAHDASKAYGVIINPNKSRKITFRSGDKIIVVSEG